MSKVYTEIAEKQGDLTLDESSILNSFRWALEAAVGAYRLQVKWLMQYNPHSIGGPALKVWAEEVASTLLPRMGSVQEIETLIDNLHHVTHRN
jgi:hypothetical protein